MRTKNFFICLPVSNEEKNLEGCIKSIDQAVKRSGSKAKLLICLNNCKDKSEEVAIHSKENFRNLNISIIKSNPGKLKAQKKMLSNVPNNKIVFFIDSDVKISSNSIKIILKEFEKHKKLLAVGGFPIAKRYKGLNPWKRLLDKTLNIRSRHPKSEISKLDVSKYHLFARTDPQTKNTSKEHEAKSKIFFHGRLFALRSKTYWTYPNPKKGVVGDDSYLPDYIIYNYGKNRIRIRYDAIVYFQPHTSLIKHYKAYKRIFYDLRNLRENFPQFKKIRDYSELIIDKEYVSKLKISQKFYFQAFLIIRKFEKVLFKISIEKDPSKIWSGS